MRILLLRTAMRIFIQAEYQLLLLLADTIPSIIHMQDMSICRGSAGIFGLQGFVRIQDSYLQIEPVVPNSSKLNFYIPNIIPLKPAPHSDFPHVLGRITR